MNKLDIWLFRPRMASYSIFDLFGVSWFTVVNLQATLMGTFAMLPIAFACGLLSRRASRKVARYLVR